MTVDALAIGAHPDDVEMGMGGTVAKMTSRGKSVAILDLTRGEMGTRGTAEIRAKESAAASKVLGVETRINLDMGDSVVENTIPNRNKVIEVIRDLRPKVVFVPYWDDRHPDHAAAGQIVKSAVHPAGFGRYPVKGDPYRPNEVLFYMAHNVPGVSMIVDITEVWEKRIEAVKCYESQLNLKAFEGPTTFLTSGNFLSYLEARARSWGMQIQKTFGEGFHSRNAVPVEDPVDVYAPFPRMYASKRVE